MWGEMEVRTYKSEDAEEIAELFYQTVRTICGKDYTPKQVEAWAPEDASIEKWRARLTSKNTLVAVEEGKVLGFAELESDGHIDCFYCHHAYQRRGVGSLLFSSIEEIAKEIGVSMLFADVSITAKKFFEAQGFCNVQEKIVNLRGQQFINFKMEKQLV
jgi:N-acetylglutamate synthase-like GNAT family acetyltransferase